PCVPVVAVVGPVPARLWRRPAGRAGVLRPAAGVVATGVVAAEARVVLLLVVLVAEAGAVAAPVVAHLTCSCRQASTRAWSPESSTWGTGQPLNPAGRV